MGRKTRAQMLAMEAELAALEEKYDDLKRKRPRCEGCGRLKVTGGRSKLDQQIRVLAADLRAKRQAFRTERAKATP